MPVRNESDFITRSLTAVLNQDYPPDLVEIIVVDGASSDGTRELVEQMVSRPNGAAQDAPFPPTRLVNNPDGIVPRALNIALQEARGEVIIRIDGHCQVAPDYVRRCVQLLRGTNAECVGGVIVTVAESLRARAIAVAQSSRFGVGGAAFRTKREGSGYVDTVAFGAYRRDVFSRIGDFDEDLVRNQDDEFNFRLIQSGGRIWLDASLQTRYFSRSTLASLWRQYYGYGFYKVRVIAKRRAVAAWRHLAPAAFLLALVGSVAMASTTGDPRWAAAVFVPYLAVNVLASLLASRSDWSVLPLVPAAFFCLHVAYGLGFWHGVLERITRLTGLGARPRTSERR